VWEITNLIPDGITAAVQTTRPYHSDVSHGIANLCDEDSELVEVAEAVWTDSQFTDDFIELLCSLHRILHMCIWDQ
jgi:hypothetical protein